MTNVTVSLDESRCFIISQPEKHIPFWCGPPGWWKLVGML